MFPMRCVLALALMLTVLPASAQSMSPAEAKKEFQAAQALYQEKRCGKALPKFRRLVKGTASPNAQIYVARCLRELGKLAEAYQSYSDTIHAADAKASEEERYAATRSAAAAERAALESKVARLVIASAETSEGLVVKVDGKELEPSLVGEVLAHMPGKARIQATAPGRGSFDKTVELKAGARKTITIVLPTGQGAAAPADPDAPTPGQPTGDSGVVTADAAGGSNTFAFIALGVGAAGLATFGVAGLMANQKFDELDKDCNGGPCPEDRRSDVESGQRLDTIANIGLIVGGVGVATGVGLLLFGGKSKQTARSTLVAVPTPSGASVSVSGSF